MARTEHRSDDTADRGLLAHDVRVCIPVEVVRAMIGLLENNHVAWPIAGAEVHRLLTAELAHIDGEADG